MLKVIYQLLCRDMTLFRRDYLSKLADTTFLLFTSVVVFAYFFSAEGFDKSYGPFILIGSLNIFGLFDVIGKVSVRLADIEGVRAISYILNLPIRPNAIFCYIGLSWAIEPFIICLPLYPFGKLLLWNQFSLATIEYGKALLLFASGCLFYGYFSLWLTGMMRGMSNLSHLFIRVVNPLFMFGCYWYTWQTAYKLSPIIGYISLLNPVIYIMEGMRSAVFGPTGYLPFWICLGAIWIFILLCALDAIRRLRKRLDCI